MKKLFLWTLIAACIAATTSAEAKLSVVASTSDMAYFTRVVAGALVDVDFIAPPTADVHFVEARPSYMVKTSHADVVVKVGLELDMWMDKIIDGSRNNHLTIIDCSKYIKPLDVPSFKADASYGDLHRFGNPHYWLTPENAEPITQAIMEGLSTVDPEHAADYKQNRDAFLKLLSVDIPALKTLAEPLSGKKCICYHSSWAYLSQFTGLSVAGFVEPFPGVPPSPSHVADLIEQIKKAGIDLIVVEPYFDKRVPEKIAEETGAHVVTLYPSIGGRQKDETYTEFLKSDINLLLGQTP